MFTQPLKILVAHGAYQQRGGEDVAVEAEVDLLRANGHEVQLMRRDNASIDGTHKLNLLQQTLWSRDSAAEVQSRIQSLRPDIIHVHNTFPLLSPSIYWTAVRERVPVVQTLHNFRLLCPQATFLRESKICEDCLGKLPWRGIAHRCYRGSTVQTGVQVGMLALHRMLGTFQNKITRYIALSRFSREKFIAGGLPADKIVVKPNFVDIPGVPEGRRASGLYVGRLSEEKGVGLLAKALAELPGVALTVIGNGPCRTDLLAAHAQVRWLGWRETQEVYAAMHNAAFLVMPSIGYEQFPRTLAEAFACGLPIIACRNGPLAELIEDGKTGLLFDGTAPEQLVRCIAFAEAHPEQMREMGARARAEYEAKYTPQTNHQQLMAIYREAMVAVQPEPRLGYGTHSAP